MLAQIFIDNGIGGACDGFRAAQPSGKAPGKGSLARAQIPPVSDDGSGGYDFPQSGTDSLGFQRGVGDILHTFPLFLRFPIKDILLHFHQKSNSFSDPAEIISNMQRCAMKQKLFPVRHSEA